MTVARCGYGGFVRFRRPLITVATAVLAVGALTGVAPPAHAAAFPVNPGPIVEGRPIVGSGQNLPPIAQSTYNVGDHLAREIKAYYGGRSIDRDRAAVALAAGRWVREWTRANCGRAPREVRACRAAVVFDSDETLLNSYSYGIAQVPQFTFDPTTWDRYVADCGYSDIPQVRALYNRLVRQGLRIALVSAGPEANRSAVTRCLRAEGISGWDILVMRGKENADLSVGEFKAEVRQGLQEKGLRIVASVGDQVSDMAGGHLKRGFLLPNTMYYLH